NNIGFAMISGSSIRYRFYTRWGITAGELSRIIVSNATTFWIGLLFVGGLSLALSPPPDELGLAARGVAVVAGWALAAVSVAYVGATLVRVEPIRVARFELRLPPPRIALAQLVVSIVDWTLAGAVLYVLLPAGAVSFTAFLTAFLAAQLLGLVSHVPGGVGVFEGLMVLLLKPFLSSGTLLPALIVYRAVYYLLPLSVAAVGLVADELHQRRSQAARLGAALGWLTEQLTPRVLAAFTFL